MDKTYKDGYKIASHNMNNVNNQYLRNNYPGVSDDVLNTFETISNMTELNIDLGKSMDDLLEHEKFVKQMFCVVIACGYAIEKTELTKFQIIEDKQRKLFKKVMCSIVVYGCVKNKISKMEDNEIIENIQFMIYNNSHGWVINSLLLKTLSSANIGIDKFTKTNQMWENNHECFSFITNNVVNQINSERMLQQLIDKNNKMEATDSMCTYTTTRISNLKIEMSQSKGYIAMLFSHLIALTRQKLLVQTKQC